MSFKAWARANAPKAYKPPKQPPKSIEPVLSVETIQTDFQPGNHIHYINTRGEMRYGRFIRYEHEKIYAYFGDTPQESERNTFETYTRRTFVRPGWPDNPRNRVIEPVALADVFNEWDQF